VARLLNRVREWKPQFLVDIGAEEPGRIFLWTRAAADDARIILANLPGQSWPQDLLDLFAAMARRKQQIVCVQGQADGDSLAAAVEKACQHRELDFVYLSGARPADIVHADFKRYRRMVRRDGLIAWDGIKPVNALPPAQAGGDRLWTSLKPMYPQHAEYLSGCGDICGGIAMVKA
jgi:hypothetical protein